MMKSSLLTEKGLLNLVGGVDYNFRLATAEETFVGDVERLLEAAGMNGATVYTGHQVHGANVAYVDGQNGEDFVIGRHFEGTDGLLTDQRNVALLIKYADCTPIVLYDPIKKVQASVHSGWRGTVQKIGQVALEKMLTEFDCKIENIYAYVGPSIAQKHYEVGAEVYEAFADESDCDFYFKSHGEKYLLDMAEANVQLLLKSGILPENIEVEKNKTYTNEALHSARKEGKEYGLNAIVTMIQ